LLDDVLTYEQQQKRQPENTKYPQVTQVPAQPALAPVTAVPNLRPDHPSIKLPADPLVTWQEAVDVMKFPKYWLTNAAMRNRLGIPHYVVGRNALRFNLEELRRWEQAAVQRALKTAEKNAPAAALTMPIIEQKFTLREALDRLARTGSVTGCAGHSLHD
jgi:hypothetical protein